MCRQSLNIVSTSVCLALSKMNREQSADLAERDEMEKRVDGLQDEVRDVLLKQAAQQR